MSNVFRNLSGWVGALACASLLAACGGGGGSPGATPGNPDPTVPRAASVVVTASADTIASSGQAGTEVVLTAIVKDGNSRAVPGAKVVFKASSGSISTSNAVTDSNGVVTEKLSTQGDSSLRDIKISASVNGVTSSEIVVKVVQATQTLTLTASAGTLNSAGASGAEVELTALVKDSKNAVMSGVRVDLAADSGSLSVSNPVTNDKGIVTAKLNTGGDATSRVIRVTASLPGVTPATASVVVSGTKLTVNANSTVNIGTSTDITVKLVDSSGVPLKDAPVTFSSTANSLTVKGGAPAVTNSAGQLILSYAASSGSSDTITVRAKGETATAVIAISSANFTVQGPAGGVANINTCVPVQVHSDDAGKPTDGVVIVGSSRGSVFTNFGCTSPMTSGVNLANGNATVYVQASSPGIATLTANIVNGGTTQGSLEFVAQLLPSANIIVQADPAVIGANTAGSTTQQATIRAVVRDGTPANNLVKNALVTFSIVSDASGGTLTQPSLVATGVDGTATVSYVAGTSATALNGVVIRAQLQGASTASATANLTVSRRSLSITAGTGNVTAEDGPTRYRKDYAVMVSDASGNAVPGVTITASVVPRYYFKGALEYLGTDGPWQLPNGSIKPTPFACPNEDLNRDGVINPGEDVNRDGILQPGIPVTVTVGGTTDANGTAIVTLTYPRDRANWLSVDLTIRGSVQGSEAVYQAYIPRLIGIVGDFSDRKVTPPGQTSPYGTTNSGTYADCLDPN